MTPEQLTEIKKKVAELRRDGYGTGITTTEAESLLSEVDRLNAEITARDEDEQAKAHASKLREGAGG